MYHPLYAGLTELGGCKCRHVCELLRLAYIRLRQPEQADPVSP